jgi:hypothetical protein
VSESAKAGAFRHRGNTDPCEADEEHPEGTEPHPGRRAARREETVVIERDGQRSPCQDQHCRQEDGDVGDSVAERI